MAWVLYKKNGKRAGTPFVFRRDEVINLSHDKDNCYVLQNTGTHGFVRVGGKCRKKTPESGIYHGAGLGFWPFTKKKPKRNPMTRRMIWTPGKGPSQMFGRARRKRRRR